MSPTLQTGCLRLVKVILKDIGPCICTVQEESFLTDWNVFFYNAVKLRFFDEMGKLFGWFYNIKKIYMFWHSFLTS